MDDLLERYNIKTVGVAWYSPETWKRLEAMPEARIEKSYQNFLRTFGMLTRRLVASGHQTIKMEVDLDHMIAWCHRHGYEIDSTGRAAYGMMVTMARDDPAMQDMPFVDRVTRVHQ